jgi:hypothetical protein
MHDDRSAVRTLFCHSKRDQWGLAIVLRRQPDRVQMLFQDGRTRSFKNGYYHLIEAVDKPLDTTLRVVRALESMAPDDDARTTKRRVKPVSPEEQMAFFRDTFADGFADEDYVEHHRGDGRARPLKRHRDALVEGAKALSKRKMNRLLADEDHRAIFEAARAVVRSTDMVSPTDRKSFAEIGRKHHALLADALFEVLHGGGKLIPRFEAWVAALETAMGRAPTWNLTTVLLGSVRPTKHVVVRPKALALQAEWMAPGLSLSDRPMGILYERLLAMASKVQARLVDAGLEPNDLLDVVDFMWLTLKPAAKREILERRAELGLSAESADREAA